MSLRFGLLLMISVPLAAWSQAPSRPAGAQPKKIFPYEIHHRTLKNGMPVIVIPTPEFKDMVTYSMPVFAGSRNETEKGKTGLAHLFEHIMFRHQYGGVKNGYEKLMQRMGAHNNAWTNYDLTFYHPTTFTANLKGPLQRPGGQIPGLIELESARFKNLTFDKETFQVEAGAVLGEYRRIFSFPSEKMIEELSPKAFPDHPYGHTVIGYRDDVENMPQAYDAAVKFFSDYYRPNNVALIVVGDVDPNFIFSEAERAYGDWKPGEIPKIPEPSLPKGEKRVHVNWEADVSPHVMVGYYAPAFVPGTKEGAVGQLLSELLVSRSAPLFQKLRYKKQTATELYMAMDPVNTDPFLLLLDTELILDRFKKDGKAYIGDVEKDLVTGLDELKNFSRQPGAARTLQVIKSKVRNDFLGSLDSTGSIADAFARYFRFSRDPNVFEVMMQAIDSLTPADIDAYAQKYFAGERRIVTTLWKDPNAPAEPKKEGQ